MELIISALDPIPGQRRTIVDIPVDRHTLAKRRWRAVAADGREFGFDLEHALDNGDAVFSFGAVVYRIAQTPEPVLKLSLPTAADAVRLGWLLGNLHFRLAVDHGAVYAPDDPAVRQLLEREHIHFHPVETVFQPMGGGHAHGHHAH